MAEKYKVLITGGCGYIGSHTAIDLLDKGFEVISVDNLSRSHDDVEDRIKKITGKEFINYRVDCKDHERLRTICEENNDLRGIIHFAAFKSVGESVREPLMYYDNNINSLLALLKITDDYKIRDFVFSSSCSVYGNVKELPVKEDTPLSEPESPYGRTKLISEQIIKEYSARSNANYILLRYFNPVGAHESAMIGEIPFGTPENLVPNITQTAIGKRKEIVVFGNDYPTRDGSCIRDYIHVMDIADAHSLALQYLIDKKNKSNCEIFNLGSGNGISVLEAIHAFEKMSGKKLNYRIGPRRAGDIVAVYADNKKARKMLNWECGRNIDEMMLSAWNWELQMQNENFG
jgi:UDP-glucose 4-epimerase